MLALAESFIGNEEPVSRDISTVLLPVFFIYKNFKSAVSVDKALAEVVKPRSPVHAPASLKSCVILYH